MCSGRASRELQECEPAVALAQGIGRRQPPLSGQRRHHLPVADGDDSLDAFWNGWEWPLRPLIRRRVIVQRHIDLRRHAGFRRDAFAAI